MKSYQFHFDRNCAIKSNQSNTIIHPIKRNKKKTHTYSLAAKSIQRDT